MFATSLPLLPPPSTSLLPPLHQIPQDVPTADSANAAASLQQARRHQNRQQNALNSRPRCQLALLSLDERIITQRKLAIAMYGYSWLKPAGCSKTMLGRREEEIEREEVERQLREVEMQERNVMEAEEAERQDRLRRQREGEEGADEVEGMEGRDLDEEVPDMDADGDFDDEEDVDEEDLSEGEAGDDLGMDGDLDDDVPDANAEDLESSWVYDTRRETDTESEEDHARHVQQGQRSAAGGRDGRNILRAFTGLEDAAGTQAMVNAVLNEDELGRSEFRQHVLDHDVLEMEDAHNSDMDADLSEIELQQQEQFRDLDDDVPEAEEEEWQHTDTELEESEMDISLLPPHLASTNRIPGTTHEVPYSPVGFQDRNQPRLSEKGGLRRSSGNMMPPPSIPANSSTVDADRHVSMLASSAHHQRSLAQVPTTDRRTRNNTIQARAQIQTPILPDPSQHSSLNPGSVSALLSSSSAFSIPSSAIGAPVHDLANTGTGANDSPNRNLRMRTRGGDGATNLDMSSVDVNATNITAGEGVVNRSNSWLNPAGARRNLFGSLTNRVAAAPSANTATQNTTARPADTTTNSSGGLFTPSPQPQRFAVPSSSQVHGVGQRGNQDGNRRMNRAVELTTPDLNSRNDSSDDNDMDEDDEEAEIEPPRSRTRSGRLLGFGRAPTASSTSAAGHGSSRGAGGERGFMGGRTGTGRRRE